MKQFGTLFIAALAIALALGLGGAVPAGALQLTVDVPQISITGVGYGFVSFTDSAGSTGFFHNWVEYGPTTAYGSACCDSTQQPGQYNLSFSVGGFQPGTTYHIHGVSTDLNTAARTDGPDVTFTTKAAESPSFSLVQVSAGSGAALIRATVYTNGATTTARYEWGTTAALGDSQTETYLDDGWHAGLDQDESLRNLQPGATYYWRVVLTNVAGTYTSEVRTFVTVPPPVISSFGPSQGPTGTTVMLIGGNLSRTTGVWFGETHAQFTVISDSQIRAFVPFGARSPAPISVETPGGDARTTDLFTVTPSTTTTSPTTTSTTATTTTTTTTTTTPTKTAPTTTTTSPPIHATPNTRITAGPSGTTRTRRATFRFSATMKSASFQCRLDGHAWQTCKTPKTYARLTAGHHRFLVRARDRTGHTDVTPASRSWRVR